MQEQVQKPRDGAAEEIQGLVDGWKWVGLECVLVVAGLEVDVIGVYLFAASMFILLQILPTNTGDHG